MKNVKKMFRRSTTVLLSLLLVISVLPIVASPAFAAQMLREGDYMYEIISPDLGVKITGYLGTEAEIDIPAVLAGKFVDEIGEGAFGNNRVLTGVTIPAVVYKIAVNAFEGCSNLTQINVGENSPNYKSIDGVVFNKSGTALIKYPEGKRAQTYTIPEGVTKIDNSAFKNSTNLAGVTIPESVTEIGDWAFSYCTGLTSITIPDSVKKIGNSAFASCMNVTDVTIPEGVTEIGMGTFSYCMNLKKITFPGSLTKIGDAAFVNCTALTSVTIPDSVESIGERVFQYCKGLENVTIGNNVTTIGQQAFDQCTSLTGLTIPDSVTEIGVSAFMSCAGLTQINVEDGNPVYKSIDGVLFDHEVTTLIQYPPAKAAETYTIPDSVTEIPGFSFYQNKKITGVVIGNNVKSVGKWAFYDCTGLKSVTIGNSVTSIGESAFYNCKNLKNVTIPDSVKTIGDFAFAYCTGLSSAAIGNGVTYIGTKAFYCCTDLAEINVHENNANFKSVDGVLFNKDMKLLVQYPAGKPASTYTIPNSVQSVGYYSFNECRNLSGVTIPASVKSIGNDAFNQCTALNTITIPDSVTSVGAGSFSGCTALTSVTIPNSVTSVDYRVFSDCTGLTGVNIPPAVTDINPEAFYNCTGLTQIYVDPGNLAYTSVNGVLFNKDMTALIQYPAGKGAQTYTIPDSVQNIGNYAFKDSANLSSLVIGKNVTQIGAGAFYNCTRLSSITIGDSLSGVEHMGPSNKDSMFRSCGYLTQFHVSDGNPYLKSVDGVLFNKKMTELIQYPAKKQAETYTIPDGVADIYGNAFTGSTNLKSVMIPDSVKSITNAFYNCTNLSSITIGSGVTKIGANTFTGCTGLTEINMSAGNPAYTSVDGVLFNKDMTALVQYPIGKGAQTYTIPNSVKIIAYSSFRDCKNLTSVTIGNNVIKIEYSAFMDCINLKSAYFYGHAPSMESGVFSRTSDEFKIYYSKGAMGFTTPYWYGYQTVAFNLCDLFVSDTGTSPVTISDGDKVTLYAVIRNQSGVPSAGDLKINFYVDGMLIESVAETRIIQQNGFIVVTTKLQWNSWMGSHLVRVVINGDKALPETNYNNNTLVKRIKVYDSE